MSDSGKAKQSFEGGATRSAKLERYDLIPPEGDHGAAIRFGIGFFVHGEGNWKQGGVGFIKGVVNHLRAHVAHMLITLGEEAEFKHAKVPAGARDRDTDAIRCNADMLCWFQKPTSLRSSARRCRSCAKD
jgi:hypothetical protein